MPESLFEIEEVTEEDSIAIPKDPELPEYGSKEWDEYVMSQFRRDELVDGNPICAGLRRVAENLLGSIVSSRPAQVFPATDSNGPGRATVVFEIVFNWRNSGELRTFAEVADVWHGNTDNLFAAHPIATASTRAEGRALRKALKVRCLAAEELTRKKDVEAIVKQTVPTKPVDGEYREDDPATTAQINFLDGKCKQLDINVLKFAECEDVSKLKKKQMSKLISTLNLYQGKQETIPPDVVGYNKNWR